MDAYDHKTSPSVISRFSSFSQYMVAPEFNLTRTRLFGTERVSSKEVQDSYLEKIPSEITQHIAKFLPFRDVIKLSSENSHLYQSLRSDMFLSSRVKRELLKERVDRLNRSLGRLYAGFLNPVADSKLLLIEWLNTYDFMKHADLILARLRGANNVLTVPVKQNSYAKISGNWEAHEWLSLLLTEELKNTYIIQRLSALNINIEVVNEQLSKICPRIERGQPCEIEKLNEYLLERNNYDENDRSDDALVCLILLDMLHPGIISSVCPKKL